MSETHVEIVFRKGKPVAAYFHLRPGADAHGARQLSLGPKATAHIDAGGHAVGLEVALPLTLGLAELNDMLRGLGADTVAEAALTPLRSV